MSLQPCARCASPILPTMTTCPHCRAAIGDGEEIRSLPALLMGLLLAGCGDKEDTGDTGDTGTVSALYGVAETDAEGDGASGQSSSTTSNRPKS